MLLSTTANLKPYSKSHWPQMESFTNNKPRSSATVFCEGMLSVFWKIPVRSDNDRCISMQSNKSEHTGIFCEKNQRAL